MTETPLSTGPGYVYWAEPPARDAEDVRARHEDNRRAWNEGATRYTSELEETIAFIRGGGSNLHPIERANLGDLRPWCSVADSPSVCVGARYPLAVERGRGPRGRRGHL